MLPKHALYQAELHPEECRLAGHAPQQPASLVVENTITLCGAGVIVAGIAGMSRIFFKKNHPYTDGTILNKQERLAGHVPQQPASLDMYQKKSSVVLT